MIIRLKTLKNIRTLGGIKNKEGKVVKENLFIRSRCLNLISEKDLNTLLTKHNLHTVIDLRTELEQGEKTDLFKDRYEFLTIPVLSKSSAGITSDRTTYTKKEYIMAKPKEIRPLLPDMTKMYPNMIKDETIEGIRDVLNKIMDNVINEKGSTIYHCSQGKDRTGLISLLILEMLDVDKKKIYKDYLLTNRTNNFKAYGLMILMTVLKFDPKDGVLIKHLYQARKEYLDSLYQTIIERSGSVTNFITNDLGISKEKIELFKQKSLI